MNSTALQRILMAGTLVPVSAGRVEQTAIALRKAGLLPTGGRGRHAADLRYSHIANLLLGLCAPTVGAASDFVTRWSKVPPLSNLAGTLSTCNSFGEAFTRILADDDDEVGVHHVAINLDWPAASIAFGHEVEKVEQVVCFQAKSQELNEAGYTPTPMFRQVVFDFGFVQQINLHITEEMRSHEWEAEGA